MRAFPPRASLGRGLWRAAGFGLLGLIGAGAAQADPSYSYSRTSAFTYKANGLLESETIEPDSADLCVKTSYAYGDDYGNRTTTTTANCTGASTSAKFTSRGATASFAQQTVTVAGVSVMVPPGAFAISAANALDQKETREYDPRYGVATKVVGPNDLATTWSLDNFGRKVLEKRADGTSTAVHYCWTKVYDTASGGMVTASAANAPSNSAACHNGSAPAIDSPVSGEEPAEAVRYEHSVTLKDGAAISGFTRVYFDRAGRKVRTVVEGFDAGSQPSDARLIAQDVDYNDYGAAVTSTQPYFLGKNTSGSSAAGGYGMTLTEYDALGRPTTVYSVDPANAAQEGGSGGSVTVPGRGTWQMSRATVSYDGLRTTWTDDKARQRIEDKNLDGLVVRTIDANEGRLLMQHDAFGNLVLTVDSQGNTIQVDYDQRGRKLRMNDPDAGVVAYCYDALGQLRAQQTSVMRGNHGESVCPTDAWTSTAKLIPGWTTMGYDVLGRMTSRAESEYVSTWTFDDCTKGVGKLCSSSTTHGVTRKLAYDSLGRPLNQRTDIAGDLSAATAVSYDDKGRLSTQTYPTGVKLSFAYTAKGFLQTVTLGTKVTLSSGEVLPAGKALWTAGTFNAWGKSEQSTFGNGVINRAAFDPQTGRVTGLAAGLMAQGEASSAVVNQRYRWDSLNLLKTRVDAIGAGDGIEVSDGFKYDKLGRLESYDVSGGGSSTPRTVSLTYGSGGTILSKTDVGTYTYGPQGGGNRLPHAVQSVAGVSYGYDFNGNAISATGGKWRKVTYTSFDAPDVITGASDGNGTKTSRWKYDEGHQRIKETRADRVTWYLHPDNAGGLAFEREVASNATQSNRHYVTAGGQVIAVLVTNGALPTLADSATAPGDAAAATAIKIEYWHKDQLGSLIATTDQAGAVTARYAYDPFGKRRFTDSRYDANGVLVVDWRTDGGPGTDRGFTGHEHLDDLGIIHMNGRLYDPTLGRMMQPDPFIQDLLNLQNYDRYGYCFNSPLICTDPTGYSFLSKFWKKIRPFVAIAVAIVAPELIGVLSNYSASWVVMGAHGLELTTLGSAVSGFAAGAIATGNLKGALQGAFTAGMFNMAGDLITQSGTFSGASIGGWGEQSWQAVALHGVVGCVTTVAGGGKCGSGMLSAAFSQASLGAKHSFGDAIGDRLVGATIASAVIGGTASVLGGGKFANGAETAAFGYLFNNWAHRSELAIYGKEAHDLLQDYAKEWGYVTERKCLTVTNCVDGRFDIGRAETKEVWEIKRNSFYGLAMGELALDAYTSPETGLRRGGNIVGLKVGEELSLWKGNIEYKFTNYGDGLIGYSRYDRTPTEPTQVYVPRWTILPGGGRGRDDRRY